MEVYLTLTIALVHAVTQCIKALTVLVIEIKK